MENIKEYVKNKKELLKEYISSLKEKPSMVIVQVNDDLASNTYIKGKLNDASYLGIDARLIKLDPSTSELELLKLINKLNKDDSVDGFIVQMPLPKHINEDKIKESINPNKDIDGFNPLSSFLAATPKGIITYLEDQKYEFKAKNALVIGRSKIVGKPMAKALLDKDMNVTVIHSKTKEGDFKFYIEHADLIIIAIGKALYLDNRYNYKKDAIVMDVGINRDKNNHLEGDAINDLNVCFKSPVPGGVGLLTRIALLINLIECYKLKYEIKEK